MTWDYAMERLLEMKDRLDAGGEPTDADREFIEQFTEQMVKPVVEALTVVFEQMAEALVETVGSLYTSLSEIMNRANLELDPEQVRSFSELNFVAPPSFDSMVQSHLEHEHEMRARDVL